MSTKRIRVALADNIFNTLPGSTGERRTEKGTVQDTVFGQDFQSDNPTLSMATISGNSFFKGVAGYTAVIKETGASTAMVNEPAALVAGTTHSYRVTSPARRVLDIATTLNVFAGATDVTASVISVDYLSGTVTFNPAFAVVGAVTITGAYLPLAILAKTKTFTLTQTAAENDVTVYEDAQANNSWKSFEYGLKTVGFEASGIFNAAIGAEAKLVTNNILVIEVSVDGSADTVFRGFFRYTSEGQSGDVGAVEEAQYRFNLYVPGGDLLEAPFKWYITSASRLNQAVAKSIQAWEQKLIIKVQYLPNGTVGTQYSAIITEATLTNNIDGQNEFRFTYRATGLPSAVV